jgi:dipeptidyl aminopeptidase/acylaminoacyl peptidase
VTQFSELSEFVAIPRVTSLRLSPDGQWLAAAVATLAADSKKYVNSIWRIDTGGAPAERLTRSAEGEGEPAFLPDGSLLFISSRPNPSAKPAGDDASPADKPALWSLPAGRGEAYRIVTPPGGVAKVVVARGAHSYLLSAPAFNGTKDYAEDAAKRKARADAGVSAILHAGDLARYWDSDLGPDCLRLLIGHVNSHEHSADGPDEAGAGDQADGGDASDLTRDLTPDPGRALDEQSFCLSPDGVLAVTGWQTAERFGALRAELAVIDTATGNRRSVMSAGGFDFDVPVISPDGKLLVALRSEHDTYERPGDVTLVITSMADLDSGSPRDLLPGFDRRPNEAAFSADSGTVYFTADDSGRCPIFAVDVASGQPRQVTTDDAAYDNLCPAPDGQVIYALRSAIGEPPTPVRVDVTKPGSAPVRLPCPTGAVQVPGRVKELSTTVTDGSTVRSWLVLPPGASAQEKAPLVLWVHGGPVASWNSWSWRWNPWLLAARGYAVLLPDPALSTGYGHDFIARGYGTWGDKPYTDVMALTEAAAALPEIDSGKIAMMGGSFGGYMANWIAGQTGRFAAIVSHAGLWALDQMFGTTDGPFYWRREFGHPQTQPERYQANSPHLRASAITTPVLIIHGDKDYRVPVGEALRMYSDLVGRGQNVKFLYFPDENHWVLKPGDAVVWYETVLAFLGEHLLGKEWQRPQLL